MPDSDYIKRMDEYRKAFECANTVLTFRLVAMKSGKPGICKLKDLITASLELAGVCHHYDDILRHYELLIWLHHQIALYHRLDEAGPGLQMICRVEARQIADKIKDLEPILNESHIAPFIELLEPEREYELKP
ncbi:hypothetical protein [Veronia pacifica]|uniref:Uncharacterized protein n=1 Tax=Veronia pacifica TaxID=1080227 RepID=A0A1C3EPN7_9GAMM|nr:hypothetical protein [Veronia pacifica]ODA35210.1 hypothetical protein A8L45_04670 [Veronia pacifica]